MSTELPPHRAIRRETLRRMVESAGPRDLENVKKVARIMIDAYFTSHQSLDELHRKFLGLPSTVAASAGPQLPRLPRQSS